MPTPKQIPLAKKSDPARTGVVTDERLINLYPEKSDGSAAAGFYLTRTPGLTLFSETGGGVCRGVYSLDTEIISIQSQALYRITSGGAASRVSTLPGEDFVIMAANDVQIDGTPAPQVAIVSEKGVWIYQSGLMTALNMQGFPNPNSAEYIDGYILLTLPDGRFVWTAISNATAIDPLDFAAAEGDPDGLLRCLKVRRELYMMGPKTVEVWTHTEDADAPFQRVPGAVLPVGLLATNAACVSAGELYWIDSNRIVRKLASGYQAQIISNDGLHRALGKVSNVGAISMFGYVEGGHKFIALTCPDFTWVYDDILGVWAERQSYGFDRWQASCYARIFGKHIVGSSISGNLYYLDDTNTTENGEYLITRARFPTVGGFPRNGSLHVLDINLQPGVGVLTGGAAADVDPEIMMRWSIDGGATWVAERRAKIGKQAKRNTSVRFTGLGAMGEQGVVFEVSCSAAVVNSFISAFLTASPRK